ncbi:MAG: glycosyltransferase [Granulosicoccus sp.]|nr:glycosyltransferase [Granulosicoccus sp.]
MSEISICVAVCTRNRTVQLERLLHSLEAQTRRPHQVLVVDNAPSSNDTQQLLAAREDQILRYVCEPVAGLDFARNRALQEATTDVVAFIDDDAVADAGWVAALHMAFNRDANNALCTGKVKALTQATDGQRLFEANGGFDKGSARITLPGQDRARCLPGKRPLIAWAFGLGVGCNLAVRRLAALQLGGFDEALDMGATMPGGGDTDMIWRMLEAGHQVSYEPDALVLHEHRHTLAGAVEQIVGHNKASMAMLAKAWKMSSLTDRLPIALFISWRLVKPGVRLLRRSAGADPLPVPVLLCIWKSCIGGLFSYPDARQLADARKNSVLTTSASEPG